MCDPEISGANMDFVGYATPETAAQDYLDPDAVANPIYYPDQDVLVSLGRLTKTSVRSSTSSLA